MPAAPSSALAANGSGGGPRETVVIGARVALQLIARAEQEHRHLAALLAEHPGGDEPVTAIVALAADDDDPAVRDALDDELGQPPPRALHQLEPWGPELVDRPAVERALLGSVGQWLEPPGERAHSTVTVFARLRGWSTFRPRLRAM